MKIKPGTRLPSKAGRVLPRKSVAPKPVPQRPSVLIVSISRDILSHQEAPALAGGFLKAYAEAKLGGKCDIRTLNLYDFSFEGALASIAAGMPDIVAFSCYLWNSMLVQALCRRLKEKYPRLLIILGGPEATGRKADLLKKCRADALVTGEGEAAFTDLVSRFLSGRDWKGTPGVLVRSGGAVHEGPPRALIGRLDAIPSPFADAASTMGIRNNKSRFYTLETMRGCPNKCSYCMWTNLKTNKLRYFSDERIASELRWIADNTPRSWIFVADSDMFLDHRRALRLAPVFHDAALKGKCHFVFQTNLNHWDEKLMRAWNNRYFEMDVGVNSINPAVQAIFGRSYSKSLVEEKLLQMHRFSPKTDIRMQMMFAAPGETFPEFCAAFDWAWHQPVTYRLFFHTQLLHGTRMRQRAPELGIKYMKAPPYYVVSTRECKAAGVEMESLMIMFVTVWTAKPRLRKIFKEMADSRFEGSHAAAFLKIWKGMDPAVQNLALAALGLFNSGKGWFLDDFQMLARNGREPPGTALFVKTARAALFAAYARR